MAMFLRSARIRASAAGRMNTRRPRPEYEESLTDQDELTHHRPQEATSSSSSSLMEGEYSDTEDSEYDEMGYDDGETLSSVTDDTEDDSDDPTWNGSDTSDSDEEKSVATSTSSSTRYGYADERPAKAPATSQRHQIGRGTSPSPMNERPLNRECNHRKPQHRAAVNRYRRHMMDTTPPIKGNSDYNWPWL
ncbi:ORF36 [callitrichine gammaherpesvirus 3]|uniref:ORF36 n=1 Tax=callitrichine gammaherpesvirus 3 TaxID=106331 RepID=Q993H4_9GAMA|nr:ORF36 [callitrichine gammaherpesvirus 3]AAK38244.1 ORF36 [callitrichine gammaherpesvirus 3]